MNFLPPLLVSVIGLVCVVYSSVLTNRNPDVPPESPEVLTKVKNQGGDSESDIPATNRTKSGVGHLVAKGVGHLLAKTATHFAVKSHVGGKLTKISKSGQPKCETRWVEKKEPKCKTIHEKVSFITKRNFVTTIALPKYEV